MTNYPRTIKRYSISFKQKVVREIEEDGDSISDIKRKYDIRGAETVQKWLRKFGKNHLLNTIVRIEMKDEKDRIRELEAQVRNLKMALADAVLEKDVLKNIISMAEEHYETDLKKNSGHGSSKRPTKNKDTP